MNRGRSTRPEGGVGRGRAAIRRMLTGLLVLVAASATGAGMASSSDVPSPRQAEGDVEQQLAERFAPLIMVVAQDEPCDPDGEPYGPTDVEIVLDNPEIALRQVGPGDPVAMWAPGASDLAGLGGGFHLEFPGSSLDPGCVYERDFDKFAAETPPTVYAHVVQQPDVPDRVYVQYWFYWYYNDWNNKHESDWEGITLEFDASSVEEALAAEPIAVGYAQHEGGERAEWDNEKLERDGDRPVVYSSAGSHASYFGEAVYLGRSGSEGFGCDDTVGPSDRLDPRVIVLPDRVDDPDDPLAWLEFDGRWGERQSGAFNGPTGPAAKDRWLEPAPWFEELRGSSVVIPAGDLEGNSVVGLFCGVVEGGSSVLVGLMSDPVRVVLAIVILAALVGFVLKRTDWSAVAPEPIARRRRAGQIARAAGALYLRWPAVFVLFGLIYIPAAVLTGVLAGLVNLVPFVGSLVELVSGASGTSLLMAALVGSFANIAAFVVVNGAVGEYLSGEERGLAAGVDALHETWVRRRDLLGAFVRSFAIVFVLLITVIGLPWALRQLVRYQFLGQAVMIDEHSGRDALDRSSELVRGRWWHTAIVILLLNGGIVVTASVLGLLLLVVASSVPLWLFSALLAVVNALFVPLAAIAMTLLYGDAVCEREDGEFAEPVLAGHG